MKPCCATSPPPRRMGQCSAKAGSPDAHRVSRSLPLAFSTQQHPVGGPRQGPGLVRTIEQSGRRQRSLGSSIDGVSCQGGGRSDDELAGAAGGLACSLRAADARLCGRWDSFATLQTQRVSAGAWLLGYSGRACTPVSWRGGSARAVLLASSSFSQLLFAAPLLPQVATATMTA